MTGLQNIVTASGGIGTFTVFLDVAPLLVAKSYRVVVPYLRGYGSTAFLSSDTFRNAQPSIVALDIVGLMDALGIDKAVFGGFDWGQYYFATDRGRTGYDRFRHDFNNRLADRVAAVELR